jgi:phage gp36-like protein
MLDEKDLQAIQKMIQEANKQTLKDALQGASVLMESYFEPKFNLLFENQQTMLETLAPKSRVEELEEEVAFLRSVIRQHSREIEELKHA